MNSAERERFSRSMGEVAALSPEESLRREIERDVKRHGSWAQEEWRALLREGECLREQLRAVSVPDDLQQRLLEIPDAGLPKRWSPRRRWPMAAGLAAAVALSVTGFLVVRNAIQSSRLQTLALLAINNHLNDPHVSVETRDAIELGRALSEELPFEVVVPALGEGFELSGGRKCKLGTHPVAYSLWDSPGGRFSLFQCRPQDFGLPARIRRKVIRANPPAVKGELRSVLLWADVTGGYVLVGPETEFGRVQPDGRKERP